MQEWTGDVIRDVGDDAPATTRRKERLKVHVERIAVNERELASGNLRSKALAQARQQIVIEFNCNDVCTCCKQPLCERAEPGSDLKDRLAVRCGAGGNDRVTRGKVNKEALAQPPLGKMPLHNPLRRTLRGASRRPPSCWSAWRWTHAGAPAPNCQEAETLTPRPGSCNCARPSRSAACAAAPIMAALSVHQRTGGTFSVRP